MCFFNEGIYSLPILPSLIKRYLPTTIQILIMPTDLMLTILPYDIARPNVNRVPYRLSIISNDNQYLGKRGGISRSDMSVGALDRGI